jgi:hypothetical protein
MTIARSITTCVGTPKDGYGFTRAPDLSSITGNVSLYEDAQSAADPEPRIVRICKPWAL